MRTGDGYLRKIRMILHFKNGKTKMYKTGSMRRFTMRIRSCTPAKIDIVVRYGKHLDAYGNYSEFYNQYIGTNKTAAIQALKAFCEE